VAEISREEMEKIIRGFHKAIDINRNRDLDVEYRGGNPYEYSRQGPMELAAWYAELVTQPDVLDDIRLSDLRDTGWLEKRMHT